jgi:hypothetical protein
MGRCGGTLHNDSTGKDRHVHTVRSGIPSTPVRGGPKFRIAGHFCLGVAMHPFGVPVKEDYLDLYAPARTSSRKISYISSRDVTGPASLTTSL